MLHRAIIGGLEVGPPHHLAMLTALSASPTSRLLCRESRQWCDFVQPEPFNRHRFTACDISTATPCRGRHFIGAYDKSRCYSI